MRARADVSSIIAECCSGGSCALLVVALVMAHVGDAQAQFVGNASVNTTTAPFTESPIVALVRSPGFVGEIFVFAVVAAVFASALTGQSAVAADVLILAAASQVEQVAFDGPTQYVPLQRQQLSDVLYRANVVLCPIEIVDRPFGRLLGSLLLVACVTVLHAVAVAARSERRHTTFWQGAPSMWFPALPLRLTAWLYHGMAAEAFKLAWSLRRGGDGASFFFGGVGVLLLIVWGFVTFYAINFRCEATFRRYTLMSSKVAATGEDDGWSSEDESVDEQGAAPSRHSVVTSLLERWLLPHGFWTPRRDLITFGDLGLGSVKGSCVAWAILFPCRTMAVCFFIAARVVSVKARYAIASAIMAIHALLILFRRPLRGNLWNDASGACTVLSSCVALCGAVMAADAWALVLIACISVITVAASLLSVVVYLWEGMKWYPLEMKRRDRERKGSLKVVLPSDGIAADQHNRTLAALPALQQQQQQQQPNPLQELQEKLRQQDECEQRVAALVEQRLHEISSTEKVSRGCQATFLHPAANNPMGDPDISVSRIQALNIRRDEERHLQDRAEFAANLFPKCDNPSAWSALFEDVHRKHVEVASCPVMRAKECPEEGEPKGPPQWACIEDEDLHSITKAVTLHYPPSQPPVDFESSDYGGGDLVMMSPSATYRQYAKANPAPVYYMAEDSEEDGEESAEEPAGVPLSSVAAQQLKAPYAAVMAAAVTSDRDRFGSDKFRERLEKHVQGEP